MQRKVEIVPYNSSWPAMYKNEARVVRRVLEPILINIHHVGSTAIPGIAAKPILDMMGEATDILAIDQRIKNMEEIGYEARGEYGIPGRRYFVKRQGIIHTHHIHIYPVNHHDIQRLILFRNYLRAHPEAAVRYAALKKRLALQYTYDTAKYTDAKTKFVQEINELAAAWNGSTTKF